MYRLTSLGPNDEVFNRPHFFSMQAFLDVKQSTNSIASRDLRYILLCVLLTSFALKHSYAPATLVLSETSKNQIREIGSKRGNS